MNGASSLVWLKRGSATHTTHYSSRRPSLRPSQVRSGQPCLPLPFSQGGRTLPKLSTHVPPQDLRLRTSVYVSSVVSGAGAGCASTGWRVRPVAANGLCSAHPARPAAGRPFIQKINRSSFWEVQNALLQVPSSERSVVSAVGCLRCSSCFE